MRREGSNAARNPHCRSLYGRLPISGMDFVFTSPIRDTRPDTCRAVFAFTLQRPDTPPTRQDTGDPKHQFEGPRVQVAARVDRTHIKTPVKLSQAQAQRRLCTLASQLGRGRVQRTWSVDVVTCIRRSVHRAWTRLPGSCPSLLRLPF